MIRSPSRQRAASRATKSARSESLRKMAVPSRPRPMTWCKVPGASSRGCLGMGRIYTCGAEESMLFRTYVPFSGRKHRRPSPKQTQTDRVIDDALSGLEAGPARLAHIEGAEDVVGAEDGDRPGAPARALGREFEVVHLLGLGVVEASAPEAPANRKRALVHLSPHASDLRVRRKRILSN